MYLGIWNDIRTDVSQRKDKGGLPWQVYVYGTFGATRLEEKKRSRSSAPKPNRRGLKRRHSHGSRSSEIHGDHQRGRHSGVLNSGNIHKGNLRESQGIAAISNGDSIGSTYRVARMRSSDRVSSIKIWAPDIGTTTAADVGLYDTAANGGAAVDRPRSSRPARR
jgi:hypothetical protein